MNEKEHLNRSEKLLHTDIMAILGGRAVQDDEIKRALGYIPPAVPPLPPSDDDGRPKPNRVPELINSQVDEVLNTPPKWLVRYGISVFFLIFILLGAITWFVEYPDLVSGSMRIITKELPKKIVSRENAPLYTLKVKDTQMVQKGQILGILETTSDPEEVFALERLLNQWSEAKPASRSIDFPNFEHLGDLQKPYQTFQAARTKAMMASSGGVFSKKKATIEKEVSTLRTLKQSAINQLELQAQDLQMALEEAQSQERLSQKGFVSKLEAKNAMSKYMAKKQAYEQAKGNLENNTLNQVQRLQDIFEIEKNINDEQIALIMAVNSLKSDILTWKQRNVLQANTTGKITFQGDIQENIMVKAGQELFSILPAKEEIYGEMKLGQTNFGKVKIGQEVLVKLQAYPFQEYGSLRGKISEISALPIDSAYVLKVHFKDGLLTSNRKKIPFKYGMTAQADIITENLRLAEKFFYDLRKTMKR
jgi:multidrug resistance efflux pump